MKKPFEIIGWTTAILYEKKGNEKIPIKRYDIYTPKSMVQLDSIGILLISWEMNIDTIYNFKTYEPINSNFDKSKAEEYLQQNP